MATSVQRRLTFTLDGSGIAINTVLTIVQNEDDSWTVSASGYTFTGEVGDSHNAAVLGWLSAMLGIGTNP